MDQWAKDKSAIALETAPCKEVTWLLEYEPKEPEKPHSLRYALGWWVKEKKR
jgi:hypothetical protein